MGGEVSTNPHYFAHLIRLRIHFPNATFQGCGTRTEKNSERYFDCLAGNTLKITQLHVELLLDNYLKCMTRESCQSWSSIIVLTLTNAFDQVPSSSAECDRLSSNRPNLIHNARKKISTAILILICSSTPSSANIGLPDEHNAPQNVHDEVEVDKIADPLFEAKEKKRIDAPKHPNSESVENRQNKEALSTNDIKRLTIAIEKISNLELETPKQKDWWDKFDLITEFVATVILALVGGLFTFLYSRSKDIEAKAQEFLRQEVHKLDVVSKFATQLADERPHVRQSAIYFISLLLGTETAVDVALITRTPDVVNTLDELREQNPDDVLANAKITSALEELVSSPDFYGADVFFATTRGIDPKTQRYSSMRSELSFGHSLVTIPAAHKFGAVEQPTIWKLEYSENPTRHVVIATRDALNEGALEVSIRERMSNPSTDILLFTHGFNSSFDDSVRRLAQLTYDLDQNTVPLLFSWPSRNSVTGYLSDVESARQSAQSLAELLAKLVSEGYGGRIHIIGQGLGAHVAIRALEAMRLDEDIKTNLVKEMVLVAPDIDESVFRHSIKSLSQMVRRITCYVSTKDSALQIASMQRASKSVVQEGKDISQIGEVDMIDVSTVNTTLLGHSYYEETTPILFDLSRVLSGTPVDQTPSLRFETTDDWSRWVFIG